MGFREYGRVVMRRKWLVAASIVAAVGLAMGINTWTEPVFRATARIEIQKEPSRSLLTGQEIETSSYQSDNVALYTAAELITNRALIGKVVETLRAQGVLRGDGPASLRRQIDWLIARIKVEPIRDTRLVNIHVEHSDRKTAEHVADLVARYFVEYRAQQRAGGASNLVTYLSIQLEQVKGKITGAEQVLLHASQGGVFTLEEKLRQLTQTLGELRKNQVVSNTELAKAREVYKEMHPRLMVMESENLSILQNIEQTEAEMRQVNTQIRQYSVLEGELRSNRELYAMLLTKLQEAEIQGQMMGPLVHVVEAAVASPDPVRPRKALNIALCMAAGLLIGVGLAFLREFHRRTIRTPRDVDEHLQLPVIGLIPKVS